MTFCKHFTIIALLLLFSMILNAQNYEQRSELKEIMTEIIKEKMRLETNQENTVVSPAVFNQASLNRTAETNVTDYQIAESEVHAAINPTDSQNMVLCPIRLSYQSGAMLPELPVYYTKDGGDNWYSSNFQVAPKDSSAIIKGGGDPVFAFDADGKLYLSWIHLFQTDTSGSDYFWSMMWVYSTDGGENWQYSRNEYIELARGTIAGSNFNFDLVSDKQWMACDHSNSAFRNNLYIAYYLVDMNNFKQDIVFRRKSKDSASFDSTVVNISRSMFNKVQFAGITVDHQGHIYVSFRANENAFYLAKSTDGGESFSSPVLITNYLKSGNIKGVSNQRIYPAPQLTSDQSNSSFQGNLYFTFTAKGISSDDATFSNIYFCRSINGGNSWSVPVIINDTNHSNPRDQFYSNIFVNQDGIISICWYDARFSENSAYNDVVNYYMTNSFDGGLSFKENYQVSNSSSDFRNIGSKNNQFGIGEYNQVIASKGHVFPVWADGRKGNGDLDIYVAKIDLYHPTSLNETTAFSKDFSLKKIYPNPTDQILYLNFSLSRTSEIRIIIYNIEGKRTSIFHNHSYTSGDHSLEIDVSTLNPGSYLLYFETDFGYSVKKAIISR